MKQLFLGLALSASILAPNADRFPSSAAYLAGFGLATFDVGPGWRIEVTLDGGAKGVTRNLEPDLPMVVHF